MKSTLLCCLALCLGACAGSATPTANQDRFFDLPDWRGQTVYKLEQGFGADGISSPLPNGKQRLQIEQLWVLGAGGERYRTSQKDYPVRGAGAGKEPGGFNAKVLRCLYVFEWGSNQLTESAQVNNRQCPVPAPSILSP